MEPNQIAGADILDILFEGRNKDYGAYDLRKTYNKRVVKALFATGAVIGLLFIGSYVSGLGAGRRTPAPINVDVVLASAKDPDKPPPPPPPPLKPVPPLVAMKIFTPPKLVENPPADEKPPEQDDLVKVKIGTVNQAGPDDVGIPGPPNNDPGKGIVAAPKKMTVNPIFSPRSR